MSDKRFIYADNAATTKLLPEAFDAMLPYLKDEFGNPSSPYLLGQRAKKAIKSARSIIADCINAEPEEIYFTSGGSESNSWALRIGASAYKDRGCIAVSAIEHKSVINAAQGLQDSGYKTTFLKVDDKGVILPSYFTQSIDRKTALVSVMYANNEIGTIEPISELSEEAHRQGTLFHCDAVQALGRVKVDVKELGVDMLSGSAHKFGGPKGVGFLYIRNGVTSKPLIFGGSQEMGLRGGTENVAGIVGMAAALKKSCDNIGKSADYIRTLEGALLDGLSSRSIDFKRNGAEDGLPGIVSLSFINKSAEMILHRMDLKGICISSGAACDSTATQVSHVLKAIGLDRAYAEGTVRISLSQYNSEDEIVTICEELSKII